jgi:hypothetical protein
MGTVPGTWKRFQDWLTVVVGVLFVTAVQSSPESHLPEWKRDRQQLVGQR